MDLLLFHYSMTMVINLQISLISVAKWPEITKDLAIPTCSTFLLIKRFKSISRLQIPKCDQEHETSKEGTRNNNHPKQF